MAGCAAAGYHSGPDGDGIALNRLGRKGLWGRSSPCHARAMGYLIYGSAVEYELDDRVLAHLKIAIVAKLRLQESFLVNWTVPPELGSGRVSVWMNPGVQLQFRFSSGQAPELNKVWLDALARSAHGLRGMIVMTEDEAPDYLKTAGPPTAR